MSRSPSPSKSAATAARAPLASAVSTYIDFLEYTYRPVTSVVINGTERAVKSVEFNDWKLDAELQSHGAQVGCARHDCVRTSRAIMPKQVVAVRCLSRTSDLREHRESVLMEGGGGPGDGLWCARGPRCDMPCTNI